MHYAKTKLTQLKGQKSRPRNEHSVAYVQADTATAQKQPTVVE